MLAFSFTQEDHRRFGGLLGLLQLRKLRLGFLHRPVQPGDRLPDDCLACTPSGNCAVHCVPCSLEGQGGLVRRVGCANAGVRIWGWGHRLRDRGVSRASALPRRLRALVLTAAKARQLGA